MITDAELVVMEQKARVFQGAWTGTSGTLAAFVVRLIQDRRRLIAEHLSGERPQRPRLPRAAAPGRLQAARKRPSRPKRRTACSRGVC